MDFCARKQPSRQLQMFSRQRNCRLIYLSLIHAYIPSHIQEANRAHKKRIPITCVSRQIAQPNKRKLSTEYERKAGKWAKWPLAIAPLKPTIYNVDAMSH